MHHAIPSEPYCFAIVQYLTEVLQSAGAAQPGDRSAQFEPARHRKARVRHGVFEERLKEHCAPDDGSEPIPRRHRLAVEIEAA